MVIIVQIVTDTQKPCKNDEDPQKFSKVISISDPSGSDLTMAFLSSSASSSSRCIKKMLFYSQAGVWSWWCLVTSGAWLVVSDGIRSMSDGVCCCLMHVWLCLVVHGACLVVSWTSLVVSFAFLVVSGSCVVVSEACLVVSVACLMVLEYVLCMFSGA